jgi:hypothetical protein
MACIPDQTTMPLSSVSSSARVGAEATSLLLDPVEPMTVAGDAAPACYVEVKSIGALDGERVTRAPSRSSPQRTYSRIEDVPGRLWG